MELLSPFQRTREKKTRALQCSPNWFIRFVKFLMFLFEQLDAPVSQQRFKAACSCAQATSQIWGSVVCRERVTVTALSFQRKRYLKDLPCQPSVIDSILLLYQDYPAFPLGVQWRQASLTNEHFRSHFLPAYQSKDNVFGDDGIVHQSIQLQGALPFQLTLQLTSFCCCCCCFLHFCFSKIQFKNFYLILIKLNTM